jgi:hypothetical protein
MFHFIQLHVKYEKIQDEIILWINCGIKIR